MRLDVNVRVPSEYADLCGIPEYQPSRGIIDRSFIPAVGDRLFLPHSWGFHPLAEFKVKSVLLFCSEEGAYQKLPDTIEVEMTTLSATLIKFFTVISELRFSDASLSAPVQTAFERAKVEPKYAPAHILRDGKWELWGRDRSTDKWEKLH